MIFLECAPLICPGCEEPVRHLPPDTVCGNWAQPPEYSHRDGTEQCPVYTHEGRVPARPVAELPPIETARPRG